MRRANGVGLAAPQIDEPLRLAVVEVEGRLCVDLVDPSEIVDAREHPMPPRSMRPMIG